MDKKTWKKGEELIKKMPELKTNREIIWSEEGERENFMLLCVLLKGNAIPMKKLSLNSDEKK